MPQRHGLRHRERALSMDVVYEQNLDAPFLAASVDIRIAPLVASGELLGFHREFSITRYRSTSPGHSLVVLKKHTSYAVKIKERHIL